MKGKVWWRDDDDHSDGDGDAEDDDAGGGGDVDYDGSVVNRNETGDGDDEGDDGDDGLSTTVLKKRRTEETRSYHRRKYGD